MSLDVDVFVVEESGEIRILDVPPGCSDRAGFERWRRTVWGSETVRSLGARFFPKLADGDLYVHPTDVPAFIAECLVVRTRVDRIAARMPTSEPYAFTVELLEQRLGNITDAARRAQRIGGGVLIW
ncbi:hypothetical protein [Streptomyces sp. NPDC037389]|uniref:hypothetical protein n=1 Tax=Streptomyces sp. NPDC037389 TaxID=3155369 RepID=UPI0033C6197C